MREGILISDYPDPHDYFGIDAQKAILEAASWFEIPLHGLEKKQTRLLHKKNFRLGTLGVEFDFILVCSLVVHLTMGQRLPALRRIR
jgi:hypothetical protein